ncbi:MAG TPA: cell division topological specificity factor MinE [Gammaproteobacteria bacterium]|nr:cell division topological specificity factor MinE [Gammaproteobacteria bacterium]
MSILDLIRFKKQSSASTAKERLQIVVSHQRANNSNKPDYLPQLHKELLDVVSKYAQIDRERIQVQLQNEGDFSVLELNITIPSEAI